MRPALRRRVTAAALVPLVLSAAAATGRLDPLADGTEVVARAATLADLIRLARPRFVWDGRNLLWVTHDPAGRVGFRMNRAVRVTTADGIAAWCLLAGGPNWDVADEDNRYAQADDPAPVVVARHPTAGVVYQARWQSQPQSGTGHGTDQRTVILLCDGRHRWQLLGEGPTVTNSWRLGGAAWNTAAVEARAAWTGDADRPVRLSYVVAETDHWGLTNEQGCDTPGHPTRTIRWEAVPGRPSAATGPAGRVDPADDPPGRFVRAGLRYVLADRAELVDAWATRFVQFDAPDPPAPAAVQAFVAAVRLANPALGDAVAVGQPVRLPDEPPGPHGAGDRNLGEKGDPASLTPAPVAALAWPP